MTKTNTQVHVTALMSNGSTNDVTRRLDGTTYRVSNPEIATIDCDGVVTSQGRGRVLVTAVNQGTTAVTLIDISPGDPLTTISGVVLDTNEMPVAGLDVRLVGVNGTGTTQSDGSFTIDGVAIALGLEGIVVEGADLSAYFGFGGAVDLLPEAISDAGLLVAKGLCDVRPEDCVDDDVDFVPDSLEESAGLDPSLADSDGDGLRDGAADSDGDELSNQLELWLGSDLLLADADGDKLSDSEEYFTYRTDFLRSETDDDAFNDGEEIEFGSDPLDGGDIPIDLVAALREANGGLMMLLNEQDPSGVDPLREVSGAVVTLINELDPSGSTRYARPADRWSHC